MNKLLTIINAKISDKSKLGEWYTDRLKVCLECEHNSENKSEMSFKEKAIVLANLGNPSCLACGCEITAKASVETEKCGMTHLNQASKWIKLDISPKNNFIIVNKTVNKAVLSLKEDGTYLLDYGEISHGSDSVIELKIQKKGLKIKKLEHRSSCGCTVPEAKYDDKNEITFKITYDTKRMGVFVKTASLTVTEEDNTKTVLFFNINGKVK